MRYVLRVFQIRFGFSSRSLSTPWTWSYKLRSIKKRAIPAHIIEAHKAEDRPKSRQDERKKHLKSQGKRGLLLTPVKLPKRTIKQHLVRSYTHTLHIPYFSERESVIDRLRRLDIMMHTLLNRFFDDFP